MFYLLELVEAVPASKQQRAGGTLTRSASPEKKKEEEEGKKKKKNKKPRKGRGFVGGKNPARGYRCL